MASLRLSPLLVSAAWFGLLGLSAQLIGCGSTAKNGTASDSGDPGTTGSNGGSGQTSSTTDMGMGGDGQPATTTNTTGGSGGETSSTTGLQTGGSAGEGTGGSASGGGSSGGGGGEAPFPDLCVPSTIEPVCDFEGPNCGNGVVDSCEICFGSDGGPVTCSETSEECDGSTNQTCVDLGYVGGSLGCTEQCTFDVRGCQWCLEPEHQVGCAVPRVDASRVGSLALAPSGDMLAAAWMSFDGILHVARFASDLELLGQLPCGEEREALGVALAPSGQGWLLALGGVGADPELTIFQVDPAGQLSELRTISGASSPVLAEVPGEPPLLAYARTDQAGSVSATLVATRLDESGESEWEVELGADVTNESISAAFAGAGFLVAGYSVDAGQLLFPVAADGQLGSEVELPDVGGVKLARGGDDRVAATWQDSEGYSFAWLDGVGQLVGDPLLLQPPDSVRLNLDRAVTVSNGDAIVAFAADAGQEIRVFHVDADGSLSVPGYALARGPSSTAWLTATTDSENNAVFAWAGSSLVLGQVR